MTESQADASGVGRRLGGMLSRRLGGMLSRRQAGEHVERRTHSDPASAAPPCHPAATKGWIIAGSLDGRHSRPYLADASGYGF
ncbi:MAG: hypothetical protein AB7U20_24980 [Planctomycetaceae bacterium]